MQTSVICNQFLRILFMFHDVGAFQSENRTVN